MKILIVMNDAFSLLQFRKGLVTSLIALGHEVHIAVPPSSYVPAIEALGVKVTQIDIARFVSIPRDLGFMLQVWKLCRHERFDIVQAATTKPNIFATLGAWLARTPSIYALVSGAGFSFMTEEGKKPSLTQRLTRLLFKLAFMTTKRVWFQNPDDAREFIEHGLIKSDKVLVVKGSGVDPNLFRPTQAVKDAAQELAEKYDLPAKKFVLMVTARRIWSKGIREYLEAASILHTRFPEWTFVMITPDDDGSPDLVPGDYMKTHAGSNVRVIADFQPDIRPFYALADIVCLPSFYREGVPRSLLEGMSFACPVVTTDSYGCREAVVNGENGFLVPPRDGPALAEALATLMADPDLMARKGAASRQLAETVFSERHVVSEVLRGLYGFDMPAA